MPNGKFQSYEDDACYSGTTQDVLISIRHIGEMMSLHDLKETTLTMKVRDTPVTIHIKR
jgi:hypothetical protein